MNATVWVSRSKRQVFHRLEGSWTHCGVYWPATGEVLPKRRALGRGYRRCDKCYPVPGVDPDEPAQPRTAR